MKSARQDHDSTLAFRRYQAGYDYNTRLDYYDEVSENIDYLADKQWGNVQAASAMPNPVFNIEKMIQRYKVATVISPTVAAKYSVEAVDEDVIDGEDAVLAEMAQLMSDSATVRWERQKMPSILRRCVEDAWVSGDMCVHTYWNSGIETNQSYKGDFVTERLQGGNVFFGNPNCPEVERQPYILILKREMVGEVRKRAKSYGLKQSEIDKIGSDRETKTQMGNLRDIELDTGEVDDLKCNVFMTYYKEDGIVYLDESTNTVDLVKKKRIKKGRYPIAWGNWDIQENSYHGRAESSGLHTTQRFINKMFALCMLWMINNAFGKVVFDETRCSGVTNEIGVAIPVNGPVTEVIAQLKSGDFNTAILKVIDNAIEYTKAFCGLTNAALGQGAAYNTSAIVALGEQAEKQLAGNRDRTYQFVEDIYAIWADFMIEKYGDGRLLPVKRDGKLVYMPFDASMRDKMILNTKIDVGSASTWSEVSSIQTLDNMLMNQILTPIQYIERLPAGVIPKRDALIEEIKAVARGFGDDEQPQDMLDENDNERMAQFFEQLPPEQQTMLKAMPPQQMEQAVIEMMAQASAVPQGGEQEQMYDLDGMLSQLGGDV